MKYFLNNLCIQKLIFILFKEMKTITCPEFISLLEMKITEMRAMIEEFLANHKDDNDPSYIEYKCQLNETLDLFKI